MLVPIVSGISHFKKLNGILRGFVLFVIFSLVVDIYNYYIGIVYNDNQWVFKIFLICELVFFAWFYHFIFEKPMWKLYINLIFVICLTLVELLSFFNAIINDYASWYHFLFFLFFIVQSAYATIYAFKTFENNIFHYPVFWISFGRLFYFSLISFVFVYPKLFYRAFDNTYHIWIMSLVLSLFANFCLYTFFSLGLLCLKNQK